MERHRRVPVLKQNELQHNLRREAHTLVIVSVHVLLLKNRHENYF